MSSRALAMTLVLSLLFAAIACGEDTEVASPPTKPADAGEAPQDATPGLDIGQADEGSQGTDVAEQPQDTGAAPADAGSDAADVAAATDCPGGPGCLCAVNADCDAAICIEVGAQKRCAVACVDDCPKGFQCVSAGSGDVILICAPLFDRLCDPCEKSTTCRGIGLDKATCVDQGAKGAFCGVPCAADADCPEGYDCKAVSAVEGAVSKQCVPEPDDDSGKPGLCGCTEGAAAKQLATWCFVESKNDKGEVIGLCPGTRSCGEAGLSDCLGPPPELEKCDGVDNDCDGKTDEGTCDDGNGCTADACDPTKADKGKDGCVHSKLDGACDADGSVCTEKDTCIDGICTPGKAKACDDDNPCTLDGCDAAKGCTLTDDDGKACDDNNSCTAGDTCKGGACAAGKAVDCTTGDVCTAGKCNLATGKCAYKNLTSPCDDGNACTTSDVCDGGFCAGKAVDCDDANPCTADVCKAKTGCAHAPNTAPCDDGSKCTTGDGCKGGKCVGLPLQASADCDDANPCTTEGCDPKTGCTHTNHAKGCDDGNPCTMGDLCEQGKCTPGTNLCACAKDADCAGQEDGDLCNGTLYCDTSKAPYKCEVNPVTVVQCPAGKDTACATSVCDPKTGKCGAKAAPEGKSCDADGSVCTPGDACTSGLCKAGKPLVCEDNNTCTLDLCDKLKGCTFTPKAGACDDGDPCTDGDTCTLGKCVPGKNICGCQKTADCKDKEDGDACNGTLFCDLAKAPFQCKVDPKTVVKCSTAEDGPCVVNKCQPADGSCLLTPINTSKSCDDGDACTSGDLCGQDAGGKHGCLPGKKLDCDDGNKCTVDSCDKAKGCLNVADGSATFVCYGGPKGTAGKGECKAGAQKCGADGKLGPCVGEVKPAAKELCNGLDDTCDGETDTGCAPVAFAATQAGVVFEGKGGKLRAEALVGAGGVQGAAKGKYEVRWGFAAWLRGLFGS